MRRTTVVLGLLVCGLLVACAWLWRELDEERVLTSELRARLDKAQEIASARAPVETAPALAAAPPAASSAPSPATSAAAPAAAATPAPRQVTGTQEEWESYHRRMMSDPRYREAQREQSRLSYAPRRANLIRLLGFTPAEADAIIDMQIEREWQLQDQQTTITSEEMRLQRRKEAEAQEREYQAKIQALYGQERAARLEHYMESRQSRMQVDTYRTQLSGADMLREDQVEPLIEALHADRSRMREQLQQFRDTLDFDNQAPDTWRRYQEGQAGLMKEMHAAMHTSAASILSSSQLAQLDAMLERDLRRHEAQMRMNQVQSKIDRANASASPN